MAVYVDTLRTGLFLGEVGQLMKQAIGGTFHPFRIAHAEKHVETTAVRTRALQSPLRSLIKERDQAEDRRNKLALRQSADVDAHQNLFRREHAPTSFSVLCGSVFPARLLQKRESLMRLPGGSTNADAKHVGLPGLLPLTRFFRQSVLKLNNMNGGQYCTDRADRLDPTRHQVWLVGSSSRGCCSEHRDDDYGRDARKQPQHQSQVLHDPSIFVAAWSVA